MMYHECLQYYLSYYASSYSIASYNMVHSCPRLRQNITFSSKHLVCGWTNCMYVFVIVSMIIEKAPPAAFASDIGPAYHLRELPKLFGGDLVNYIDVTRVDIPLIVTSCCKAIEARG